MAGNSSWPPASASPLTTASSTPSVFPKTALQRLVKSNRSGSGLPLSSVNTAGMYHQKKKRPEQKDSQEEKGEVCTAVRPPLFSLWNRLYCPQAARAGSGNPPAVGSRRCARIAGACARRVVAVVARLIIQIKAKSIAQLITAVTTRKTILVNCPNPKLLITRKSKPVSKILNSVVGIRINHAYCIN